MPTWLMVVGAALFILGSALTTWAMVENTHFEGTVRIQSDIGHQVIDSGPYRLVRHPGYTSISLVILSMPLLLGSWWSFLPAVLIVGVLVLRTALEDHTLQRELGGYIEFSRSVRYRSLPGAW